MISLYGLQNVTRSSKVCMLHSIYLYLRVLTDHPSVDVQSSRGVYEPQREFYRDVTLSSLTWGRLPGIAREPLETSSFESLIGAGRMSSNSTFEEIYSIPQSLIDMIRQTTRIANDLKNVRNVGQGDAVLISAGFAAKIKYLESCICGWECLAPHCHSVGTAIGPPRPYFPYHLVQAAHKALTIYFYRCVRGINPSILQPYVQQTIHHLSEFDKQKQIAGDRSSNTCWP